MTNVEKDLEGIIARLEGVLSLSQNVFEILNDAVEVAKMELPRKLTEEPTYIVNHKVFVDTLTESIFGKDFDNAMAKFDPTTKKKLSQTKHNFREEANKLAEEVDQTLKNATLYEPHKNGKFKKCVRTILHTVTAICTTITVALGSLKIHGELTGVNYKQVGVPIEYVGISGFIGAMTSWKLNKWLDTTNPASKVEAEFDKLIEQVDRDFNKHWKEKSTVREQVSFLAKQKTHVERERARKATGAGREGKTN